MNFQNFKKISFRNYFPMTNWEDKFSNKFPYDKFNLNIYEYIWFQRQSRKHEFISPKFKDHDPDNFSIIFMRILLIPTITQKGEKIRPVREPTNKSQDAGGMDKKYMPAMCCLIQATVLLATDHIVALESTCRNKDVLSSSTDLRTYHE